MTGLLTRIPPRVTTRLGVATSGSRLSGDDEAQGPHIYWARHGDTLIPTTRRSGGFDTPLSEHGRDQVYRAAVNLKILGIFPTWIVSSQLLRATQSAKIFCDVLGLAAAVEDMLLNEQDWAAQRPESDEALGQRAAQVADRLRSFTEGTVLVVSHERLGQAVVRKFEGHMIDSEPASIPHAQVVRLQPQPTAWL